MKKLVSKYTLSYFLTLSLSLSVWQLCLPAPVLCDANDERRVQGMSKSAFALCSEGKYKDALPIFKQITWLKPDSLFYQLQFVKTYLQVADYKNCESEALKGIAKMEGEKVKYARYYLVLLDCYMRSRQFPKAIALAEKCLKLFPHRPDLIAELRSMTKALNNGEFDKKLRTAMLTAQEQESAGNVKLKAMELDPKASNEPGMGLDFVVNSPCFTKFKLLLGKDKLKGDSGVVSYLMSGPNYNSITLVDDESRNYLTMTLDALLKDHCSDLSRITFYSDVTKTGTIKIGKYDCEVYRCQVADESSYDVIQVYRKFKVSPGLAASMSKLCFFPTVKVLPIRLESHYMDTTKVMHEVLSIKEAELPPFSGAAPAGYNKSANITEFMYSQDGKMQLEDVDQMLATPKSHWTAPKK